MDRRVVGLAVSWDHISHRELAKDLIVLLDYGVFLILASAQVRADCCSVANSPLRLEPDHLGAFSEQRGLPS
jgi:hypothetical protein